MKLLLLGVLLPGLAAAQQSFPYILSGQLGPLPDQVHRKGWVRALTDYQLPGTLASDLEGPAGHAAQRYHLDSPSQSFLLDPTGHIIAVNL
jgi:hypothetical protein